MSLVEDYHAFNDVILHDSPNFWSVKHLQAHKFAKKKQQLGGLAQGVPNYSGTVPRESVFNEKGIHKTDPPHRSRDREADGREHSSKEEKDQLQRKERIATVLGSHGTILLAKYLREIAHNMHSSSCRSLLEESDIE